MGLHTYTLARALQLHNLMLMPLNLFMTFSFVFYRITNNNFFQDRFTKLNHCMTSAVYHEAGEKSTHVSVHLICSDLSIMSVFIWLNTVLSVFVEVLS